ncbi:GNAT family protein [Actinomyces sp. MRS3W]|uniref:GNAT family N-acetyltransferase n=1 Tax=Actinomyces sp. MRS3W TaxID=2800796 RepID=UPI0028FD8718|nr:GNAT family protein [Actinomyces sp. MRS3W]MDU0348425.1 GNAT family protein [Actinomyces sp. MRS3W]
MLATTAVSQRGLARGPSSVVLRPIRSSDEAVWRRLRLADDARLTPWEATLPPGSPDELGSFSEYVRAQNRLARRGEAMPFVLEVDGVLAGQVSVSSIRWGALECASVGYWIGAPWEGRGIMTLAVAMVLDHLLGESVGLHRVEIDVRPENARSLALCRRLGLREEGLRRGLMHINGAWADHVTFAVVAEEAARTGGFVKKLGRM